METNITKEKLKEFCDIIYDNVHALFDDDEEHCRVDFIRGDRYVTFVIQPDDSKACSLIIGKDGRIIHRIEDLAEVWGEVRRMEFEVVVNQPPKDNG
jgi:predicted RNA-binding protein YlqC (UPF0109 family)